MNKNAIKKFATEARRELISRVGQRALRYGISDKEIGNPNDDSVGGHLLSSTEKKQRAALIEQIKEKGYEQVMEEVAYTWFNRFSALRFMEVNGYLPTRVRVFTDENNAFKPQILTEAIHMELDGLDMEKVYAYKEDNNDDELYKYLLITQCNALNSVLPGMFQKIADYTELLFPDNLLREGSVVQQMIELIPEEDWKDAVQIIGWLYQYYNSEKKNDVFAALKKNVKITKENIPAATQLFTPDWIVRYMVENSLGRLWVEGHPNDELKSQWKYYLEEAEQEPDVQAQLASIREEYKALKPEDILCIDPCSGSGHILAYMFDVLVQIYEAYGVDTRTAVASIVENNIYGLDIDDRAAQLAYFSVMMKACQYDKRFLRRKVQPHVYAIVESNHVDPNVVDYFCNGDAKLKEAMDAIIRELHDAKEYGSIITVSQQDWAALYARFDEIQNESVMSIYTDTALRLKTMVQVAEVLSKRYIAVVTNPPYMGASGMSPALNEYVKKQYPDTKSDMSTVFMEKTLKLCSANGFMAMINIPVWMFLSSYKKLRVSILNGNTYCNMLHFGRGVFGSDFGTTAFVIRKKRIKHYVALYQKLFERQGAVDTLEKKEQRFHEGKGLYKEQQENFLNIPGNPVAYSLGKNLLSVFAEKRFVSTVADVKQGLATGDNNRFLRLWYEAPITNIKFDAVSAEDALNSGARWFPYNKGGAYRKWFGNVEYVVNWENDGFEIKNIRDDKGKLKSRPQNLQYFFRDSLTWSKVTIGGFSMRYVPKGSVFDVAGCSMFPHGNYFTMLGLMNSCVQKHILSVFSQSVNYEVGQIAALPVLNCGEYEKTITDLVKECVDISKKDWDTYEISWNYRCHPFVEIARKLRGNSLNSVLLADCYHEWDKTCSERFEKLKRNEEALNSIFIQIYGLGGELTPEVDEKDVTVRLADLEKDTKAFISFAVGCMFGRYSLDVEGLAYAGGEWDDTKYSTFGADKDNIIPISDDEYFEDDIVGKFVEFIKLAFGAESLQENLNFISNALGGHGNSRDVIRNYFMNSFYADHCSMCSSSTSGKRPYYWMFDSGKKNGFKALIYMHRYQPDTLARIRTDYVHEQQARYRTAIADLENRIANASTSERVKLNKQLKKLNDQATEIHAYEEKIHHLADQMISIDLDDGVKKNYAIFQDVLAKIK